MSIIRPVSWDHCKSASFAGLPTCNVSSRLIHQSRLRDHISSCSHEWLCVLLLLLLQRPSTLGCYAMELQYRLTSRWLSWTTVTSKTNNSQLPKFVRSIFRRDAARIKTRRHPESSNPSRIAVNPNTNMTFDLSTQNRTTYRISQGHSHTLGSFAFSYASDKQTGKQTNRRDGL